MPSFESYGKEEDRLAVLAWRDAAIADGWIIEQYFKNESIETAFRLRKDGFLASCTARPRSDAKGAKISVSISIWAPDELMVNVPMPYNWEKIKNGIRQCDFCHKENHEETYRVALANRSCADCLSAARKKLETPGWCD